jgi:SnoaL-like domain
MVLYGENDRMSEAREVVERFYECFGEGDMTEAFALFAADYISLTPSGSLNNEKHEAVARNLKHAIPDGHMEMIHTLESGGEIFVNGGFMGTHRNDLSTPFGTIVASNNRLTCSSPTTSEWRAEKSLSVGPYGIGSVSLPSSGVHRGGPRSPRGTAEQRHDGLRRATRAGYGRVNDPLPVAARMGNVTHRTSSATVAAVAGSWRNRRRAGG